MKYMKIMTQIMLAITLGMLVTSCAGTIDSVQGVYSSQVGEHFYNKGDHQEALIKFQEAARLNNPYACYRLYVMYQYGQGTAKNPEEATRMLEKAAALGDETSQVILGSRLLFGNVEDRPRGVRLLEAAAAKENRYAYEYLALAHKYGLGVEPDAKSAMENQRLGNAQGSTLGSSNEKGDNSGDGNSKTELTRSIQNELKKLGYYHGKVDGLTGPMTKDAITRFQKDRGYPLNPVISDEVLAKIRGE